MAGLAARALCRAQDKARQGRAGAARKVERNGYWVPSQNAAAAPPLLAPLATLSSRKALLTQPQAASSTRPSRLSTASCIKGSGRSQSVGGDWGAAADAATAGAPGAADWAAAGSMLLRAPHPACAGPCLLLLRCWARRGGCWGWSWRGEPWVGAHALELLARAAHRIDTPIEQQSACCKVSAGAHLRAGGCQVVDRVSFAAARQHRTWCFEYWPISASSNSIGAVVVVGGW